MMHMKATESEEHIAKVSAIKNALNASFLPMMGTPSLPASFLYPPGKVKVAAANVIVAIRIATNEVFTFESVT
jgi:hypothetical protein